MASSSGLPVDVKDVVTSGVIDIMNPDVRVTVPGRFSRNHIAIAQEDDLDALIEETRIKVKDLSWAVVQLNWHVERMERARELPWNTNHPASDNEEMGIEEEEGAGVSPTPIVNPSSTAKSKAAPSVPANQPASQGSLFSGISTSGHPLVGGKSGPAPAVNPSPATGKAAPASPALFQGMGGIAPPCSQPPLPGKGFKGKAEDGKEGKGKTNPTGKGMVDQRIADQQRGRGPLQDVNRHRQEPVPSSVSTLVNSYISGTTSYEEAFNNAVNARDIYTVVVKGIPFHCCESEYLEAFLTLGFQAKHGNRSVVAVKSVYKPCTQREFEHLGIDTFVGMVYLMFSTKNLAELFILMFNRMEVPGHGCRLRLEVEWSFSGNLERPRNLSRNYGEPRFNEDVWAFRSPLVIEEYKESSGISWNREAMVKRVEDYMVSQGHWIRQ